MTVLAGDLAPASDIVSDPIVVIDAFRGLLSRLSGERFVWWAVEDLHWADPLGRDAVRYVVQLMQPPERLLVSCTLRTHDRLRTPEMSSFLSELIRSPRTQRISLETLETDQVEVQLASLRGGGVGRRAGRTGDGLVRRSALSCRGVGRRRADRDRPASQFRNRADAFAVSDVGRQGAGRGETLPRSRRTICWTSGLAR